LTAPLDAESVLSLLEAIARGDELLRTAHDPQALFTGELAYVSSGGWRLMVFVDCNSYGGFERVDAPDGRSIAGRSLEALDMLIDGAFARHAELEWVGFGLGGYHDQRCRECGASRLRDGAQLPLCGGSECAKLRFPPRRSRLKIGSSG
jgi:hypothetical protein